MVLQRKIYKKLLEWKNESKGKKALMVEGARRIGKSTICEEFGMTLIPFLCCCKHILEKN